MDALKKTEDRRSPLVQPSTVMDPGRRTRQKAPAPERRSSDPLAGAVSFQAEQVAESRRRTIRQAMRIGAWVWPAFTLLDAYMCFVLYPDAPFALFVAYRITVEAVMLFAYAVSLRPDASLPLMTMLQRLGFFLAALAIALMALHLGGLRSVYMHGISLVCLVHASVVASHWRHSLSTLLPIGLVFPAVMGVAALVSPSDRAEWYSMASVAVFASNYVFVAASAVIGMVTGHAVWAARQQVYRARQLGRYRLQAPIGAGGMGEVWLAWDGSLRRNVALKILRLTSSSNPSLVHRFEREAYAASQLRGPHTVRIYDFGASDDGIYYIAMEYLSGLDLHALVTDYGPIAAARTVQFGMQACLSLEEAHGAGIIHRDIKPQNLFLTRDGEDQESIKLLDFGLARLRSIEAGPQLTRSGLVVGTPTFMAPELWQGSPADQRSDLYALGATLYFLLAGAPPFEFETAVDLLQAHAGKPPVRPSERLGAPVPEALEATVMQCLAKSPEHRFQSAGELRRALAAAVDPGGWTASDVRSFWGAAAGAHTR